MMPNRNRTSISPSKITGNMHKGSEHKSRKKSKATKDGEAEAEGGEDGLDDAASGRRQAAILEVSWKVLGRSWRGSGVLLSQ